MAENCSDLKFKLVEAFSQVKSGREEDMKRPYQPDMKRPYQPKTMQEGEDVCAVLSSLAKGGFPGAEKLNEACHNACTQCFCTF